MAGAEEFGLSVLMSNIYLFQWFSIVASCKLAKLQSFCKITAPYFEAQLGANRIPQQIPLLLTGRAVDFLIHPSYLFFSSRFFASEPHMFSWNQKPKQYMHVRLWHNSDLRALIHFYFLPSIFNSLFIYIFLSQIIAISAGRIYSKLPERYS